MSAPEPSNPTTAGPKHCSIAEAQVKHLETVFMNVIDMIDMIGYDRKNMIEILVS